MPKRSCLVCKARKVCSSWFNIRRYTAGAITEHGDYSKFKEVMDSIASLIAKNCNLFYRTSTPKVEIE